MAVNVSVLAIVSQNLFFSSPHTPKGQCTALFAAKAHYTKHPSDSQRITQAEIQESKCSVRHFLFAALEQANRHAARGLW